MGTRVVRNTQLRVSAEWCTLLDSLSKGKEVYPSIALQCDATDVLPYI